MAKNTHLIHAIYNEPWLISINNHRDYIDALVRGVLDPNIETESIESEPITLSGRVAIIPINGVLTKSKGYCGAPGMDDYSQMISQAISDQSVDAIVLKIYSPGGMVNGIDNLSSVVRSSTKPIVAFVDDLAGSCAYWLAVSCHRVIANSEIATVGSIGVVAYYSDHRAANQMHGITEHIVYAPQSTNKNREYREAVEGNYTVAKEHLSVIAEKFISHVRLCRPTVIDSQLTGDIYFAKDVCGTLIDSIGSIDFAISEALSLCQSSAKGGIIPNSAITKTNIQMNEQQFSDLATAVGVESFEVVEGHISLNIEQVAAVNDALISITSSAEKATEAFAAARATIEAQQATIDAQSKVIAANEKGPAEPSASVAPTIDPVSQTGAISNQEAMKIAREFSQKFS